MEEEDENFFPQEYNLEKMYDEQLQPLLKNIFNICNEYGIPFIACIQYARNSQQDGICAAITLPAERTSSKMREISELLKSA